MLANKITLKYVLERARRCTTYSQFQRNYYALYLWAKANGAISAVEKVLPPVSATERNLRGAKTRCYPDEAILADAKLFTTRLAWKSAGEQSRRDGEYSHYGAAIKRGKAFMQKCCAHMIPPPPGRCPLKYSDQQVIDSAAPYLHKGKWKKACHLMYNVAIRRPAVFKLATAHMTPDANPYAGCYSIYAFEFQDGHAYVGLTFLLEKRREQHARYGPVFTHRQVCPNYAFQVLEGGLPDPQSAILRERHWIEHYHSTGWKLLNTAGGGSLGTLKTTPWTREEVLDDALRFAYRTDWIESSQGAYMAAKKNDWFEEAVAHMPRRKTPVPTHPVSDETRVKMSAAAKIRATDPVWRANHSATMRNKARTRI